MGRLGEHGMQYVQHPPFLTRLSLPCRDDGQAQREPRQAESRITPGRPGQRPVAGRQGQAQAVAAAQGVADGVQGEGQVVSNSAYT